MSDTKFKTSAKQFFRWIFMTQKGNCILLLLVLLAVSALLAYTAVFGMNMGSCTFHELTGLNCISCGATRATLSMLKLDFATAFYYNPFTFLFYGTLLAWYFKIVFNVFRKAENYKNPMQIPSSILFVFLALSILFGIIRNLPFYQLYLY